MRIGPAVVGWVGVGVVSQSGKHGCDGGHVSHHVDGDLPHPLGKGLDINWFNHLVCRALHPVENKTINIWTPESLQLVFYMIIRGHKDMCKVPN